MTAERRGVQFVELDALVDRQRKFVHDLAGPCGDDLRAQNLVDDSATD